MGKYEETPAGGMSRKAPSSSSCLLCGLRYCHCEQGFGHVALVIRSMGEYRQNSLHFSKGVCLCICVKVTARVRERERESFVREEVIEGRAVGKNREFRVPGGIYDVQSGEDMRAGEISTKKCKTCIAAMGE